MASRIFESYSYADFPDQTQPVRNHELNGLPIVALLDKEWDPAVERRDQMHVHNCYEFGLCLTGSGQIHIGERIYPFARSTMVAVPPDVRHFQDNNGNEPVRWRYLLFDGQALLNETPDRLKPDIRSNLDRLAGGVYYPAELCDEMTVRHVERLFRICRRGRQMNGPEADALLRLLLAWAAHTEDVKLPLTAETNLEVFGASAVQPALEYITTNYHNEIRVAQLAAACAMSESYFRRIFDENMQMSPMEYVNRFRMNRAIYMLKNTNAQVSAIAEQTGYASITTFNRNFRKYMGMTAQDWRKRVNETGNWNILNM